MTARGKYHQLSDMVEQKRQQAIRPRETVMGIQQYLPTNCVAEHFTGSVVIVSTDMTLDGFRELVISVPPDIRKSIVGYRNVARLPEKAA